MTKHTAGEWEFDPFDQGYILGPRRKCKGSNAKMPVYIAEIVAKDSEGLFIRSQKEREANGRLIAAAPDLLAALKDLLLVSKCKNGCAHDDMTCATRKAQAAIEKATEGNVEVVR